MDTQVAKSSRFSSRKIARRNRRNCSNATSPCIFLSIHITSTEKHIVVKTFATIHCRLNAHILCPQNAQRSGTHAYISEYATYRLREHKSSLLKKKKSKLYIQNLQIYQINSSKSINALYESSTPQVLPPDATAPLGCAEIGRSSNGL